MLIGLVGQAQAGKTTLGDYLKDKYGFTKFAFADPLKQMLINADLITYEEAYINKTIRSRELLQKIGTGIFRNQIDKDFWVKEAEKTLKKSMILMVEKENVVIDDIRFPDESELIKKYNGIIVKVVRENHSDNITNSDHESEKYVDIIPYKYLITAKSGEIGLLQFQMDIVMTSEGTVFKL
jgi:hypothetical protein